MVLVGCLWSDVVFWAATASQGNNLLELAVTNLPASEVEAVATLLMDGGALCRLFGCRFAVMCFLFCFVLPPFFKRGVVPLSGFFSTFRSYFGTLYLCFCTVGRYRVDHDFDNQGVLPAYLSIVACSRHLRI